MKFLLFLNLIFLVGCSNEKNHKEFNENQRLVCEGLVNNDSAYGLWNVYYESGKKCSYGKVENGEKIGLWLTFYENGDTLSKAFYLNGKRNGIYQYYKNNSMFNKGIMEDDLMIGNWVMETNGINDTLIEDGSKSILETVNCNCEMLNKIKNVGNVVH